MKTPTFGLFDHIEGIPGDAHAKLFKDRLDFIRTADEAGFAGFHLAEHHGTDLSMAPNQDVFIAAASQITENIRLGPMVKLLPMHHPVQVVEDLCVLDHLTNGRLDYGVGRGAAPVEHAWHGGDFRRRASASSTTSGSSPRRCATARSPARTASSSTSRRCR